MNDVITRRQAKRIQNGFKVTPVTLNMTDVDSDEYDWRWGLCRINMTGGDLAKYRTTGGDGLAHYIRAHNIVSRKNSKSSWVRQLSAYNCFVSVLKFTNLFSNLCAEFRSSTLTL